MSSNIDITKPTTGNATTESVRQNFVSAKAEIEALQNQIGYVDYNDSATAGTPIRVSPSTWTKLTNNKLGANTRTRLPSGITNLWNSTTNQLDLTQLPVDTMVEFRVDIAVTTSAANQVVKFRNSLAIGGTTPFQIETTEMNFKTAGAKNLAINGNFYVGSIDVSSNPGEFQLWSDASCTVVVRGWYIKVTKHIA